MAGSPIPYAGLDTVVVWFRRDLRLEDNPALIAALQSATNVIPVFVWSPEEEGQFQPGRCSRWWLKHSLIHFRQQLANVGSRLVVRRSEASSTALVSLVQETGAQALFFNHLYDPISLVRDHEVKQAMSRLGVLCRSYNADLLYEPWEVLDENEEPFTCFKEFWGRVVNMPYQPPFPLPASSCFPLVSDSVQSLDIEKLDWFMTPEQEASSDQLRFKWKPGYHGAMDKMEQFLEQHLHSFEHDRAKVDRDSTSQLSPWIHCGSLSVRTIYYRVRRKQAEWLAEGKDLSKSCTDFLQQMGYREYSRYLSFHFPFIHERALLAHLRACPWRIDQYAFKAWKQGLTGYPLVDAAMKQLWSTGWMHNRMRVVAASFMVKNLLLPWQWGLKHYWDTLLDADLECDALGWQYVSGCMADAHPFSYMMDLETEAKRFDPDGEYVRRWLPVLARVPTRYIHEPWNAPEAILAAADVELGFNYPHPVISTAESAKHVRHACSVIDKSSVYRDVPRHPYRPATEVLPNAVDLAQKSMIDDVRPARIARMPMRAGRAGADHAQELYAESLLGGQGRRFTVPIGDENSQDDAMSDEEVVSNVVAVGSYCSAMSPPRSKRPREDQQQEVSAGLTVPTISATPSGALVPNVRSGSNRSSDRPTITHADDTADSPDQSPEHSPFKSQNDTSDRIFKCARGSDDEDELY